MLNIDELSEINAIKILDVLMDIREELELSSNDFVLINIVPQLIKFPVLFPTDGIKMRDRYGDFRWKACEFLKKNGIINDFVLVPASHRWDAEVKVYVNNPKQITELCALIEQKLHQSSGGELQSAMSLLIEDKYQLPGGKKFIVIDGIAHWIPDSETRDSLGLNKSEFRPITTQKEIDSLNYKTGSPIDSVKNARLIRDKNNTAPVYVVFNQPFYHKRHVPNPDTLAAIQRGQHEVEIMDSEAIKSIKTGPDLREVRFWDNKETQRNEIVTNNVNISTTKVNDINIGKNTQPGREEPTTLGSKSGSNKDWWVVSLIIIVVGGVLVLVIGHYFLGIG